MTLTLAQTAGWFTHSGIALAGVAAMALPIIIHLLSRMRKRQQTWGAMRFLMQAYQQHKRRLQLEQLLLLALRCLLVLIFALALAEPLVSSFSNQLGLSGAGRVVYIVIDDSLSTHVEEAGQTQRIERLKDMALRTVNALDPEDRVALWRAARPVDPVVRTATVDHQLVREQISNIRGRYSASDLVSVLAELDQDLAAQPPTVSDIQVVLLSDFAQHTLPAQQNTQRQFAALRERATLLVARPSPAVENVQVQSFEPRRHMILASEDAVTIWATVGLRRFGGESAASTSQIEVSALRATDAAPVAVVRRQHSWLPGQTQAKLNIDLPLEMGGWSVQTDEKRASGNTHLILRARLEPDALQADDQAWSTVQVRRQLRVGLIAQQRPLGEESLDAARWLEVALAPQLGSGVGVTRIEPSSLEESRMAMLDAAIVMEPHLLGERNWQALGELAKRGGLVWLMVSPEGSVSTWAQLLQDHLSVDWQMELEPSDAPENQPLGLAPGQQTPEALSLLSSDWDALLAPVWVSKYITVAAHNDAVWLRLANSEPLLLAQQVGDGHVLLLTTALDSAWTNLPTKPLLVPLLHETLRGLLGESGQSRRLADVVSGERPALGHGWQEAQRLTGPEEISVPLQRVGDELLPSVALTRPGIYTAAPGAPLPLAVGAHADAGDTRALDSQRLTDWLSPLVKWQWINPQNPLGVLQQEAQRASLAWPLLWLTLLLLLLETVLAKYLSHAKAPRSALWQKLRTMFQEGSPS